MYADLTKTDQDVKITFLIGAASSLIKAYIGDIFVSDTSPIIEYATLDYETNKVFTKYYPINSLVSVEEEVLDVETGSTVHTTITQNTDYYIDNKMSIVRIPENTCWPMSPNRVKITYTGGFSLSDIPSDIKLATMELVTYYKEKGYLPNRSLQGATIINNTNPTAELPAHVRAILDEYTL